jgi:predicted dehydrogenase
MSELRRPSDAGSPKIALVGCGAIAELFYLPALAKYPSVLKHLVLVDSSEARLDELGRRFGVPTRLQDYRQAVQEGVRGAIVAAPDHLHFAMCTHFLDRGVHVLCEKPLAESSADAEEVVRLAGQAGVAICVDYTRRLFASAIKVKELLTRGAIGKLKSVSYTEGFSFRWPTISGYYFDWRVSTKGVLFSQGAHVLDLICWWLGGRPELLSFQSDSFGGPEALAYVRFQKGDCAGEVRLSYLNKLPDRYVLEGDGGAIEGSTYDPLSITLVSKGGRRRELRLRSRQTDYFDYGERLVANFLKVIEGREAPLIAGGEVLDSVRFSDECYAHRSRFEMPWYEDLNLETVYGR